jgi:hypothetical protein
MKVTRAPVVYIAAEGGQGARKRAAALVSKYGEAGEGFWFLLHPVNLLRADADLGPLVATLRELGERPGLIVLDTLSRAMAGGDENASTDMGAMVKHLDALRAATSAHLLVVHHTGKDRAKGARGHSLLRAATDTEIEVGDRQIAVTKQRDLDKSYCSGFDLDVMTLGVDGDGDPITSCTVRLVGRDSVSVGVATPTEERIVRAVAELEAFNPEGKEGVSVADILEFVAGQGDNMSDNSVRLTLKKAVQKGLLTKCLRGRWKSVLVQSGPASGLDAFL